jgi:hypothetical protein
VVLFAGFIINYTDEGMIPRSSIFAYPVPAKEEARSKDTRSPQGPALRLGVEGKKHFVNPDWLHIKPPRGTPRENRQ